MYVSKKVRFHVGFAALLVSALNWLYYSMLVNDSISSALQIQDGVWIRGTAALLLLASGSLVVFGYKAERQLQGFSLAEILVGWMTMLLATLMLVVPYWHLINAFDDGFMRVALAATTFIGLVLTVPSLRLQVRAPA